MDIDSIFLNKVTNPSLMHSIVGESFEITQRKIHLNLMLKEDLEIFFALCNQMEVLESLYKSNKFRINPNHKIETIHYIHALKSYEILRNAISATFSCDYIVTNILRRSLNETHAMSFYLSINREYIDDYILYSLATEPEGISKFYRDSGICLSKSKLNKLAKKFSVRKIMSVFSVGENIEENIHTNLSYSYLSQASHSSLNISDISYTCENPPTRKFTYVNTINQLSQLLSDMLFLEEIIIGGVFADIKMQQISRQKRQHALNLHRARTAFFKSNSVKKDVLHNLDIKLGVRDNKAVIVGCIDK
ncbi:MAG: hypothetical protein OEZ16_04050 [Chromatiales bacterium]|nr:hypothetical protein [Chromatiales bacterium]